MENKKLYAIYHGYSVDGGYGDAVWTEEMTGLVLATQDEIDAYINKYHDPIVYDHPYDDLVCHNLRAEEMTVADSLEQVKPYGETDYYGKEAHEYAVTKEFEQKYGYNWMWSEDCDRIFVLYNEAIDKVNEEKEGET